MDLKIKHYAIILGITVVVVVVMHYVVFKQSVEGKKVDTKLFKA